jgi:hypothetical protein
MTTLWLGTAGLRDMLAGYGSGGGLVGSVVEELSRIVKMYDKALEALVQEFADRYTSSGEGSSHAP